MEPITPPTTANALLTVRLIWFALLSGQAAFCLAIAMVWNAGGVEPLAPPLINLLTLINLAAVVVLVPLGYFIRNQCYKRHWHAHVVAPRGYVLGNVVLLAICEGLAMFGLVVTLLSGAIGLTIVPAVIALAVQLVNFPNGRAMEPDPFTP